MRFYPRTFISGLIAANSLNLAVAMPQENVVQYELPTEAISIDLTVSDLLSKSPSLVNLSTYASEELSSTPLQVLKWDDLIPQGFDLYEEQSKIFAEYDLNQLVDGTIEANEALARVQAISDKAPVVAELNGKTVKLPGFAVPLEYQDNISNFLLVPYFGACIHTPPPPANQIVLIEPIKPVPIKDLQGAVWVTGELIVEQVESELAVSGYKMKVTSIEPYY